MPQTKVSPRRTPCNRCKEKHLACNDAPRCRACERKGLECVRPLKLGRFVARGSAANYESQLSASQSWVRSSAREIRLQTSAKGTTRRIPVSGINETQTAGAEFGVFSQKPPVGPSEDVREDLEQTAPDQYGPTPLGQANSTSSPYTIANSSSTFVGTTASPCTKDFQVGGQEELTSPAVHAASPQTRTQRPLHDINGFYEEPILDDIHQACLLKHYIDELSYWLDTTDPLRRFAFLVPDKARNYPPLQNAIFAVAARHLCRTPVYMPAGGILFKGQLLRQLTPEVAVKYMLRCLPALREFNDDCDGETRELILTTAVILRQFEEIDDDDQHDLDQQEQQFSPHSGPGRINFLSVINAVLRSSGSEHLFRHSRLLGPAYWINLRQEVYFALRKGHAPETVETPQHWIDVNPANKLVMHANRVVKWLYSAKSQEEWLKLKDEESVIESELREDFNPILSLPPKKEAGEVFPTIWYRSTFAVTGMQHLKIAQMILLAESPSIGQQLDMRTALRNTEGQVRTIVLDLCGIALNHPETPPALLNATLAIHLYGDYFTDSYERKALKGVLRRLKDTCAWPVPEALKAFN